MNCSVLRGRFRCDSSSNLQPDRAMLARTSGPGSDYAATMKHVFSITLIIMVGCASSPDPPLMEELRTLADAELCDAYVKANRPSMVRTEIERRMIIPVDEWALIDAAEISAGMSFAALICSIGLPRHYFFVSRVDGRGRGSIQIEPTGKTVLPKDLDLQSGSYVLSYLATRHVRYQEKRIYIRNGIVRRWE